MLYSMTRSIPSSIPRGVGRGAQQPASFSATYDLKIAKIPATDEIGLDEKTAASWPLRNQESEPTCIAHAVVACLELLCQRRFGEFPQFSARFLYERMGHYSPSVPAEGAEKGFRKLTQAQSVLQEEGICNADVWPDSGDLEQQPDSAAIKDAALHRATDAVDGYWDYLSGQRPPGGVASLIYSHLVAGRPVAIALPAYNKTGDDDFRNNWNRDDILRSGHIQDPAPDDKPVAGSGHAVCIVGFQPSDDEPLGGYFVFRNSLGYMFGTNGSDEPSSPPPRIPARGYGTISASHVENHCWELLSFLDPIQQMFS